MSCLDDATILSLVEGWLAPELISRVDEHIDSCASCRAVVTLIASSRAPGRVLARGDNIGRYVIGDLLGAGAMGRVYSAWEPELDRRVAIKVLHDEDNRDRLVKEAQAMARLNHPNVVTVHEVGSTGPSGSVFVAMELVDGETLRAWANKSRTWRDVARVLVEVARGLDAVHAAGVVHRDIKPDNVIVGTDGRVRLGDFGLARSGAASSTGPASAPPFGLGTLSGGTAVAGTPAYMAPEVLRGGPASAASDQFSFGVMAYELLAGDRPFEGSTWASLLRAMETHAVPTIPDVPSWLDAVVQRCLALDPAFRYPSMAAVADTLADRLSRKRPVSWIAVATTVGVLASLATWFVVRTSGRDIAKHEESGFRTGWGETERAQFVSQGIPRATIAAIDRWVDAWNDEHSTTSSASGSVDQIAARERCLIQRRDEMTTLLRDAPRIAPGRLLDAVTALPPPAECRNADSDPLPANPARLQLATTVLEELPKLRAAVALAGSTKLVDEAMQLVERAKQSTHMPTLADALLVEADALRAVDKLTDAAVVARDAVAAAERGHADLLRARAWLARVAIAGDLRDLAAAEDLGAVAHAAIDRIGAPHLAASLARLRGLIAYNRGHLDEARALLDQARSYFVANGGERTLDIASVDSALGSVARAAGDLDEAERRHRSVLALDRELRGPNHRDIARDLHNIAGVFRLRGDLDAALAAYREALAVEVATQGERSIAAALTHNSMGLVELARADYAAASSEFTIARDILTAANHGERAFAEHNLGIVAQALGHHEAALAHFDAASKIYATTIGWHAPAALRLIEDRAASERALRGAKPFAKRVVAVEPESATPATPPQASTPPSPKPAKHDIGVYGAAQSW